MSRGMFSAIARSGARSTSPNTLMRSPPRSFMEALATASFTNTWPSAISSWTRARLTLSNRSARNWSRRLPASSAATETRIGNDSGIPLRRILQAILGNGSARGHPVQTACVMAGLRQRSNGLSWPFMFRPRRLLVLFLCTLAASTVAKPPASRHTDGYQVVHIYPHDSQAFTQGLIYADGHLYESTGLEGRSSIRMVDLSTGQVLQKYDLPRSILAKGSLMGAAR